MYQFSCSILQITRHAAAVCDNGSNTTRNSGEFPRYVIYLLFNFQKLWSFRCFLFPENSGTPTFPISGNSGLRRFPRFSYYVILLVSCLHPSLVTPSAVGNTSLSLDPQFPFALLYCFRLCNSDPILCTRYNSIPLLSYKYLYSVPR